MRKQSREEEPGTVIGFIAGTFFGAMITILCLGLMAGCVTRAQPPEPDASDIARIKHWEARR